MGICGVRLELLLINWGSGYLIFESNIRMIWLIDFLYFVHPSNAYGQNTTRVSAVDLQNSTARRIVSVAVFDSQYPQLKNHLATLANALPMLHLGYPLFMTWVLYNWANKFGIHWLYRVLPILLNERLLLPLCKFSSLSGQLAHRDRIAARLS